MRLMLIGVAAGVLALTGCTDVVAGEPMADPNQTAVTTTPTWHPMPPEVSTGPTSPELTVPPVPPVNGMSTTCSEYASMDETAKEGMIALLADNGYPGMKRNPLIWTSFVGAMCTIAPAGSTVVQAINNKVPG